MRFPLLVLFLLAVGLAGCRTATESPAEARHAEASPFVGDPWPEIRARRIASLLPAAMTQVGVDAWMVICRENNNDPMAPHVGCENAGGFHAWPLSHSTTKTISVEEMVVITEDGAEWLTPPQVTLLLIPAR